MSIRLRPMKTGAGRAGRTPKRVPDAESWPCPVDGVHDLTNGGGQTFCVKCGLLWADIDSEIRVAVGAGRAAT